MSRTIALVGIGLLWMLITHCTDPLQDEAVFARAQGHVEAYEFEAAEQCYDSLLSMRPENVLYWSNYGTVLFHQEKYTAAVAAYDRAIGIDSTFSVAYFGQSSIAKELGDLDESLRLARKAISYDPEFEEAHMRVGDILFGLQEFESAKMHYQRGLDGSGQDRYYLWVQLGRCNHQLHLFSEAADCFSKAIAINADRCDAFYGRGIAIGSAGEYEDAFNDLATCLELDPKCFGMAYTTIVQLALRLDRKPEACHYMRMGSELMELEWNADILGQCN